MSLHQIQKLPEVRAGTPCGMAYAQKQYNRNEEQTENFIKSYIMNVLVLDSGARSATTSFAENGQGDVKREN